MCAHLDIPIFREGVRAAGTASWCPPWAVDDLVRLEHEQLEGERAAGERPRNRRPQREGGFGSGSRSEKVRSASQPCSARPGRSRAAGSCAMRRYRTFALFLGPRSHPAP
jgi:hypothetical protein